MKTKISLLVLLLAAIAFAADTSNPKNAESGSFVMATAGQTGSSLNFSMVSPRHRVTFSGLAQCEYAPESSVVYLRLETAEQPFVEKRGDKWVIIISKSLSAN